MTPHPARHSNGLSILELLRPHWKSLSLALLAVVGQTAADLLEPWPLKIVLDYLLQSKGLPSWLSGVVGWMRPDKLALLNFAVLAVALIAVVGALGSYSGKVPHQQRGPMGNARPAAHAVSHIQRLSLSHHDQKSTGDLISRVTSDIEAIQSWSARRCWALITNVLAVLGMLAVMLYLAGNSRSSLWLSCPCFSWRLRLHGRIKKASRAVRKKQGEIVSVIDEVFSSMRVVKAFAREDYEEGDSSDRAGKCRDSLGQKHQGETIAGRRGHLSPGNCLISFRLPSGFRGTTQARLFGCFLTLFG